MAETRIMHYLNQFFAGMGGEEKIDMPLDFREEALGPGRRLQALLGDSAKIVVTVFCGDNYFAYNTDHVLKDILKVAKEHKINMITAGPAFAAGRYGFACSEVCQHISASLDIPAVTAMYKENPGVEGYKQYKNLKVFLLPTSDAIKDMDNALSKMAQFVSKLASGASIGSPSEAGYMPHGIRIDMDAEKTGADRAIDMLVAKIAGLPFETEIPYEVFEEVPIPPAIADIKEACIALASTSGVTTAENPYGFKMARNTKFEKYDIGNMNSMKEASWDVWHAGYGATFMIVNPNYGVPLDASRELEREGEFAKLYPYFYGTTGVEGTISDMEAMGRSMVADMRAEGVDAVLLVST